VSFSCVEISRENPVRSRTLYCKTDVCIKKTYKIKRSDGQPRKGNDEPSEFVARRMLNLRSKRRSEILFARYRSESFRDAFGRWCSSAIQFEQYGNEHRLLLRRVGHAIRRHKSTTRTVLLFRGKPFYRYFRTNKNDIVCLSERTRTARTVPRRFIIMQWTDNSFYPL